MLKYLNNPRVRTLLLVIFGVLVVFTFVGQQWLEGLRHAQINREVYRIGGRSISAVESTRAREHIAAVEQALRGRGTGDDLFRLLNVKDQSHWVVLLEEARRHGLVGGTADATELVNEIASMLAGVIVERQLGPRWNVPSLEAMERPESDEGRRYAQVQGNFRNAVNVYTQMLTPAVNQVFQARSGKSAGVLRYNDALAEVAGVLRLMQLYNAPARPSVPRIAQALRQTLDRANTSVYWLPVDRAAAAKRPEPDDAQVQAHFDRFKDRWARGTVGWIIANGEGKIDTKEPPFGYRQPDSIRVQLMTADLERLADAIEIKRPWVLARAESLKASAGAVTDAVLRERAQRALRDELIEAAQGGVARALSSAVDAAQRTGKTFDLAQVAEQASKVAGESMVRKAAEFSGNATTEIPVPASTPFGVSSPDVWISRDNAETTAPFTQARIMDPATPGTGVSIAEVIASVDTFKPARRFIEASVGHPLTRPFTAFSFEGETFRKVFHWVLVTEARPERVPPLGEVRAQVVEDLKSLAALAELAALGERWVEEARAGGFDGLAAGAIKAAGFTATMSATEVGRRETLQLPEFAGGTRFAELVMDRVERMDFTKPIAQQPPDVRYFALTLEPSLGVAVVRVDSFRPLTQELTRAVDADLVSGLAAPAAEAGARANASSGAVGPLAFDVLKARLKVTGMDERPSESKAQPQAE
jgi:hypothetical protein